MSQRLLSAVGSSQVAVLAGANTTQVTISQVPGTLAPFQVYDANGNLLATIPSSGPGSYQWTAPATAVPFSPGQTVGFVSVPTGTQNFIVNDTGVALYPQPNAGGIYPAAGAIGQKSGRVFLTGATAQAYTLALPTPGSDDFKEIEIVNQSAQAHTVTTPANGFDGAVHICTMTAGPGVVLVLMAFQGVWYSQRATGSGLAFT